MLDVPGEVDALLEPEPCDRPAQLVSAAFLGADHDEVEVAVEESERLDRGQRILSRLDPADEQRVRRPVGSTAVRVEDGIDAIRRDDDLLLGDPVVLREVVLRVLGDGEHPVGAARRGGDEPPEEHAVAAAHQPRHPLEREVVDRDDGASAVARRDDVVEVRQRRLEPLEEARQPVRHAHRLAPGRERERLDAFRNEIRAACDRGEPLLVRERRELAEERGDVRLVAGATAPEHVRVDDDEWFHPASSR